jgi:hypothetical protein
VSTAWRLRHTPPDRKEEDMTMTLTQFFRQVHASQQHMKENGLANVYIQHDTLTPHNVRIARKDVPLPDVPKVSDIIEDPHAGYMGAPARWVVTAVDQIAPWAYTVTCSDAPQS